MQSEQSKRHPLRTNNLHFLHIVGEVTRYSPALVERFVLLSNTYSVLSELRVRPSRGPPNSLVRMSRLRSYQDNWLRSSRADSHSGSGFCSSLNHRSIKCFNVVCG